MQSTEPGAPTGDEAVLTAAQGLLKEVRGLRGELAR